MLYYSMPLKFISNLMTQPGETDGLDGINISQQQKSNYKFWRIIEYSMQSYSKSI